MAVNESNIDDVFTYHAPYGSQTVKYDTLRSAAEVFALAILRNAPTCADQQAAIRKVREALMTANAAIALEGAV